MKKEKLTIAEKLDKKEIKKQNGLIWAVYSFLSKNKLISGKYNTTYRIIDNINDEKGPAFVIWNHLSRRDHFFIKNITSPRKFYMVAGYNEFFKGHLRKVFDIVNIIPKKNFTQDTNSIRLMSKVIKDGGTIAFSPEGMSSIYGCNQPIVPGTGRFLKFFRIPVYFVKIEGAYLCSHKTCTEDHPGQTFATISKLFSKEDIERMSGEEIDNKINEAFRHDDYLWNKEKRIKFNTKGMTAKNMSSIAYKCPKCGEDMVMKDENNKLYCSKCGNGCTIDDYLDFIPLNKDCVIPESLTKWVEFERRDLILKIRKDNNYSFSFPCNIASLPKYKLLKKKDLQKTNGRGIFTIDHNGLHYKGTCDGEELKFDLSYKVYYTLIIEEATDNFSVYSDGEFYTIFPDDVRSVGKALLLTEEMHRLHVNFWKNFSWNNHLYIDTELENK